MAAVLVERDGHDPVCGIEGLFHPITMVDVDINVEDTRVVSTNPAVRGGGTEAEAGEAALCLSRGLRAYLRSSRMAMTMSLT
jgi:hypothetical protein